MFEGLRGQEPDLVSRGRLLGQSVLEILSPSSLSSDTLALISHLDLRRMRIIHTSKETGMPGDPIAGQLALAGLEDVRLFQPEKVRADLLRP